MYNKVESSNVQVMRCRSCG